MALSLIVMTLFVVLVSRGFCMWKLMVCGYGSTGEIEFYTDVYLLFNMKRKVLFFPWYLYVYFPAHYW